MNKYNEFIGVKDSMDAPRKLMTILYDKQDRERLFRDIQNTSPDWSVDLFREYFENELAQRKVMKQDFTPHQVSKLTSKLVGVNPCSNLDICSGTGSIVIAKWYNDRLNSNIFDYSPSDYLYTCEEASDRAIPFLLFNLLIRGMNAVVYHIDSLTRYCNGVFLIQNDKDDYMQFSSLNLIPYTDEFANYANLKWTNFRYKEIKEGPPIEYIQPSSNNINKTGLQLRLF